jgi:type II secretory pathway component PulK
MKRIPVNRAARRPSQGVALIIVLLTLFTLGVMAGIFSYAMKVETRLAVNTSSGTELEWLGRSGIEVAKWVLIEQDRISSERGYSALNQFWAGGPGPVDAADNPFAGVSLRDIQIGDGRVSIQIVDQERWVNINTAVRNPAMIDMALSLAGADATDASMISGALADWIDRDDFPHTSNGAESDYYLGLDPPMRAKNGPIDDIRELLLVRGVTPELFWGPRWRVTQFGGPPGAGRLSSRRQNRNEETEGAGLVEMFCALSNGRVNINTAPEPVLQLMLGGNPSLAREIVKMRSGPDGIDGTEDDEPARNPGEIQRLLGPAGGGGASGQASFTTQSFTFSVRVTAELGATRQTFRGMIRRAGAREFQMILFRRE